MVKIIIHYIHRFFNCLNSYKKDAILKRVIYMKINPLIWMQKLDSDIPVLQYNITGTHDCVTQYVQFSHIAKCQNLNIYQQLCLGIRALDIRVASSGNRLVMVHAVAKAFNTPNRFGKQMDLEDVLNHCCRFLEEYPSETIIFQFKNDSGTENEKCFNNLFYTYIKGRENKWFTENRIPALGDARGKIVLIRRCRMENKKEFTNLNTGIDFSGWIEQEETVPAPLLLETSKKNGEAFIVQDRYKYKPVQKWNDCVKPFLDKAKPFDGMYIINYLSTSGGLKGPKKNADYINPQFLNYKLDKTNYYGTIYCDFPTQDLVNKIIETNF